MEKRNRQTLTEELYRMRKLINFKISEDSHCNLFEDVIKDSSIGEQDDLWDQTPKTPNWGISRKGDLDFDNVERGVPMMAKLKNRRLDKGLSTKSVLYITTISAEPRLTEKGVVPKDEIIPANIELKMDLQDPFDFDKTELTESAKNNFKRFIESYFLLKEKNSDIWGDYLSFLKSKSPIEVKGWASRDDDPEQKIDGKFKPCVKDGGRLRKEYNQCLSQKRAEKIVEMLYEELPELDGLFKPVGYGETDKFNGVGWTKEKKPSNKETAPNRRFILLLPKYEQNIKDVVNDEGGENKEETVTVNTYFDMSNYFGIEAKIPGINIGKGSIGLDTEFLNKLYDTLGDDKFKSALPTFISNQFNEQKTGKGKIESKGFVVTVGTTEINFNNWTTTPKEIHSENVAPRISTNFIPCIVGRSVKDYTPVRLIAIGLALDTNPKGSGGVNVLY